MRVLFLCTGNSARSQMAEGWARRLGAGIVDPWSAGTRPAPKVHPSAIEAMAERGIDLSGHLPKSMGDVPEPIDLVVTVCAQAADECPLPPFGVQVQRWDLPDPAAVEGSPDEIREAFRASRDEIERRVRRLLQEL